MKSKNNPSSPSKSPSMLRAPDLLSPQLEADIRAYLDRKHAAGFSDKAALSLAFKHFKNAIDRDIKNNPDTRKRVTRWAAKKEIASYKWYVRIPMQIFPLLRLFISKKSRP
jgi:hypothetical protein